jgi:CDP-diacylglycerol--serine O-phosphatidyltransferase
MIGRRKKKRDKRRRGIYILPNLFTTASLFSGFYSIISAIGGHYYTAAVAILISCVFDMLDGRIARWTRTTSRFGLEYDSLSDLVAFGVAPGILAFLWALQPYRRLGWLAAFLYVATCALRLARFNTQVNNIDSRYFNGLPCPSAAALVATSVLLHHELSGSTGTFQHPGVLIMIYILSYLMVSAVPYHSFKSSQIFQKKPFHVLVAAILLIMVIAMEPHITLFILTALYVASGPVLFVALYRRRKAEKLLAEQGQAQ